MSYTRGHKRTKIWNLLGHLHSDLYQLATAPFLQNWFSKVVTQKNKRSYNKPSLRSKPSICSTTATFSAFLHPWLLPPQAHLPDGPACHLPMSRATSGTSCLELGTRRRKEKLCFKHKCRSEAFQSIWSLFWVITFLFGQVTHP